MAKSRWRPGQESPTFYRVARAVVRALVPLVTRLRSEGEQNIPAEGPVILAVNHIAWMDIPLMSVRVARVTHYMAKIELFRVPVLGLIIRSLGAFPVHRGEGDRESLRTAEQLLAEGKLLIVFPEGHRSGTGQLLPGHPGTAYIALKTGVPVVPVAISGTEHTLKGFRYGPFAPHVLVQFGKPMVVGEPGARRTRESLSQASDQIMRSIAAMLPPEYRGAYADLNSIAPVAGIAKPAADAPQGVPSDVTPA